MSLARFTHYWKDVKLIKSTLESNLADTEKAENAHSL